MELTVIDIVVAVIVLILALWYLGFFLYAIGFNPPVWMIDLPWFGVPRRWVVQLAISVFVLAIIALFFAPHWDLPYIDQFLPDERSG